jgi:hypothetical protein
MRNGRCIPLRPVALATALGVLLAGALIPLPARAQVCRVLPDGTIIAADPFFADNGFRCRVFERMAPLPNQPFTVGPSGPFTTGPSGRFTTGSGGPFTTGSIGPLTTFSNSAPRR